MSYKFLAIVVVLASAFFESQTKSLHPNFKEMTMENSFDESSGQCKYFDSLFKEGQSMVPDEECQYICTCHVSEHYEGFLCEPLCPRYIDQACSPGWKNSFQLMPAGPPEFNCFCSEMKCVPSVGIEAFRLR